jgi:hypothetical protein
LKLGIFSVLVCVCENPLENENFLLLSLGSVVIANDQKAKNPVENEEEEEEFQNASVSIG